MHNLLEVPDQGQHRQRSLDDHAIVPLTALTDAQVVRLPSTLGNARIRENHGLPRDLVDNGLAGGTSLGSGQ